jgi:hypothetical protein
MSYPPPPAGEDEEEKPGDKYTGETRPTLTAASAAAASSPVAQVHIPQQLQTQTPAYALVPKLHSSMWLLAYAAIRSTQHHHPSAPHQRTPTGAIMMVHRSVRGCCLLITHIFIYCDTGAMVHGKREGKGKYTWSSGASYEGEYAAGLKQGTGTMVFPDKGKYEGEQHWGVGEGGGSVGRSRLQLEHEPPPPPAAAAAAGGGGRGVGRRGGGGGGQL